MSRTLRRNKPYLIKNHVQAIGAESQWYIPRYYKSDLTPQQNYERELARFTHDHRRSIHSSAPRWFRHLKFTDPQRRAERDEIRRCLQAGCWDNHLTGEWHRGANAQWHWIHS